MDSLIAKILLTAFSAGLIGLITAAQTNLYHGMAEPFFLALAAAALYHLMDRSGRRVRLILLLIPALAVVTILVGWIFNAPYALWMVNQLYRAFFWLMGYLSGIGAWQGLYGILSYVLLILILTWITWRLLGRSWHLALVVFNAAVLIAGWALYGDHIPPAALLGFCLAEVFFIMENVRLYRRKHDHQEYHDSPVYLQWLLPICLLISLVAVAIPARPRPVEWKWLDSKLFPPDNRHIAEMDPFSISRVGYGHTDNLGGPANPTDETALIVYAERPVYLKALTRDTYTGTRWTSQDPGAFTLFSDESPVMITRRMWERGLSLVPEPLADQEEKKTLLLPLSVTVRFEGIATRNLFYPEWFVDTAGGRTGLLFSDSGGGILMMFKRSRPFTYTLEASVPNLQSDVLEGILTSGSGWLDDPEEEVLKLSLDIRKKYLVLPDRLPARVRELAVSLTEGATNRYDKARAVEAYLNGGFEYTLEPPEIPAGADFVDHFLFEGKTGYCTYFATAMTVLLRCAGVPARYVEGYAMPTRPTEKNTYVVTNQDAHAWTEVFFDGIGWIPFEPTPAFADRLYWQDGGGGGGKKPSSPNTGGLPDEFLEDMEDYDDLFGDELSQKWLKTLLTLFVIILLAGIGGFALVRWNRHRRSRFRDDIRRLVPAASCVQLFRYYMKLLRFAGLSRKSQETALEFARRVQDRVPELDLTGTADIFGRARYGPGSMEAWETRRMLEAFEPFMTVASAKMGKTRAFILGDLIGLF